MSATLATNAAIVLKSALISDGALSAISFRTAASFLMSSGVALPLNALESFELRSASSLQFPAEAIPERSGVVVAVVVAASVVAASVVAASVVTASVVAASVVAAVFLLPPPPHPAATSISIASRVRPRARIVLRRIGLLRFTSLQ